MNRFLISAAGLFAAASFVACTDAPVAVDHASLHAAAAKGGNAVSAGHGAGLLKAVHAGVARFHSQTQAEKAGYVSTVDCVQVPGLGAMGVHYVNQGLIDPVFDAMQPEALLYLPQENGQPRLVGVEYIVINVGQPRPSFDGHPMDIGGVPILTQRQVPHWSLHVWVNAENPNGTFTPFNPTLSCPATAE